MQACGGFFCQKKIGVYRSQLDSVEYKFPEFWIQENVTYILARKPCQCCKPRTILHYFHVTDGNSSIFLY